MSDGMELEPLDVEVEDVPGTDVAVRGGSEVEAVETVDGEVIDDDQLDELVLEDGHLGVAYQPHAGPVSSDVSPAAISGEGSSGGGFHWTKPERGGGGGGGGAGKPKRRRRGGSGGGSGSGIHISLFGGILSGFRPALVGGSVASNNAVVKADNNAGISTGRTRRPTRKRGRR